MFNLLTITALENIRSKTALRLKYYNKIYAFCFP